jgi:hypothetical protein
MQRLHRRIAAALLMLTLAVQAALAAGSWTPSADCGRHCPQTGAVHMVEAAGCCSTDPAGPSAANTDAVAIAAVTTTASDGGPPPDPAACSAAQCASESTFVLPDAAPVATATRWSIRIIAGFEPSPGRVSPPLERPPRSLAA